MKPFIALLVYALIFTNYSSAANCQSLGNGNWNTTSTWSCGTLPTGGDNIRIMASDTVRISAVTNIIGAAVTLTIDGVFLFDNPSAKLRLPCGSVIIITSTGSIQSEGVGQPSHSIRICRDEVWSGNEGTLTGPLIIGIILPIELTYFDAKANGTEIDFSWQTATEKDNDYFTIEGSKDGLNWFEMHRIDGAGTTQEVQDYSLTSENDEQFEYFRLKQTDFDGQFSYSDMVAVQLVRDELVVYPNPSDGHNLTINLSSNDDGFLQILSTDGRVEFSTILNGEKVLEFSDLNLEVGSYLLRVHQSESILLERLIIQ